MTASPICMLFDLDGTVIDSMPGILASSNAALRALGHQPDNLDIISLIGPPLEEAMANMLGKLGDNRVAEAVLAYREHYGSVGFLETTIYPGIAEALDQLRALDARLYIATSKRTVFADRILRHLDLIDLFEGVHGSEPGGAVDRKADLIAAVLRRHRLNPEKCLMVGDRRYDAEGALSNRVSTIGVLWGYGDRNELTAAGVAHLASHPSELVNLAQAHAAGP